MSLLRYDSETGKFFWLISPSRNVKAGDVAGKSSGRSQIKINGVRYLASRLAWLYVHGCWPSKFVDHIDGNPQNNRISNLREASNSENQQNLKKCTAKNKSCGFLGVTFHKKTGKWQAQIEVNGSAKYLGLHDTPEKAHMVYLEAKARMHPFQTILGAAP